MNPRSFRPGILHFNRKGRTMRSLFWAAWHLARGHLVTLGRPYDAPVGTVLRCRCGHRRTLI